VCLRQRILPKTAVSLHAVAQITLPDGRRLAYQAIGAEDSAAV
jgi:hypothetical protein